MSKDAKLPCIVCGTVLRNVLDDADNQPSEGTEFRTFGHYGSTFWDSFSGEEIVINVCDACLQKVAVTRIARQKRFRVIMGDLAIVGRQWVQREMVPWFDGEEDDDPIRIEVHEIGTLTGYANVEWADNWRAIKADLAAELRAEDGDDGGCKHVRFVAECTDCGARPLEGLR